MPSIAPMVTFPPTPTISAPMLPVDMPDPSQVTRLLIGQYLLTSDCSGASQSVHRPHKREAEADPQFLLGAAPYVNDGPVAGPLTAAFGDLVSTPRGLVSQTLEGFSEDLNMDGFVDPVAQAAPVVAPVAPFVPAVSPFIRTVASPVVSAPLVAAPAPVAAPVFHAPAPVIRTVAAPFVAAPVTTPVGLTPHDCVTPHGCAVKAALLAGTRTGAAGHVTSTIVKREAEAEAEADADAYYYSAYNYASPYGYSAYNPFYNYFGAYSGYPYTYGLGPYSAYAGYPYAAPVAAPAPLVADPAPVVKAVAAPAPVAPVVPAPAAPLVKSITKPVTYTHIGAHPVNPTTVLETETFF
jgi:hypothetical protein